MLVLGTSVYTYNKTAKLNKQVPVFLNLKWWTQPKLIKVTLKYFSLKFIILSNFL